MCTICASMRPYLDGCEYEGLELVGSEGNEGGFPAIAAEASVFEGNDAAAGITTNYSIEVGDTFLTLSGDTDTDWVAVDLQADTTYHIDLDGLYRGDFFFEEADTTVRIYSSSGDLLATNDNAASGRIDSVLQYTTSSTDTYYVSVTADEADTYSYLKVNEYGTLDNSQVADQLIDGYWEANGSSARNWNVSPGDTITVNLSDLDADEAVLAQTALDMWTAVSGIKFASTNSGADIEFINDEPWSAYASSSTSGGYITGSTVNVGSSWVDFYGTNLNGYAYQTYLHEIGHALGLGHAGNYNGFADFGIDNYYENDNWQASVMSYFAQSENPNTDASQAFIVSPMIADILAIQSVYGTAGTLRTGATTYGFGSNAGSSYNGIDALSNAAYTIIDDGGTDTLDFSDDTQDQTIDLRQEGYSSVYGETGNVGIMIGSVIENANAGSGDDTIYGTGTKNVLYGNLGDDTINGYAGADTIYGGTGEDTLNGGAGRDTINGGRKADAIYGGNGDDRIIGANGDDVISGGAGNDVVLGGGGNDTVTGGKGDDQIRGDASGDVLKGGDGNDTISGGNGNDRLYGDAGNDTFVFGRNVGSDRIFDFEDGEDMIQIYSGANNFSDLTITDDGADALITFYNVSVRLKEFDHDQLDASDFIFT